MLGELKGGVATTQATVRQKNKVPGCNSARPASVVQHMVGAALNNCK